MAKTWTDPEDTREGLSRSLVLIRGDMIRIWWGSVAFRSIYTVGVC